MSFQSDMADDIDSILGWAEGSVDFEYKLSADDAEWSDGHGWISGNKSDFGHKIDAEGVSSDLVLSVPSTGSGALGAMVEDKSVVKFDGLVYVVKNIDKSHMSCLDILSLVRFDSQRRVTRETRLRRYDK
jgi:hypothetical protein